jgi:hypothetical protein
MKATLRDIFSVEHLVRQLAMIGSFGSGADYAKSSTKALASFRSGVPKPSVNPA